MENAFVDFVKFYIKGINVKMLLNNNGLDFRGEFAEATGEAYENKLVAKYFGCKITLITTRKEKITEGVLMTYQDHHLEFTGSLHKLSNGLQGISAPSSNHNGFNGNRFTYSAFLHVIQHLTDLFGCTREQMVLQNIEFGVNVNPKFDPQLFLKGLLYHRGKPFEYKFGGTFAQVGHERFYIKIYNKGVQYDMDTNVLRIELKYVKMHDLKPIGIQTMADINQSTLLLAHSLLLQKFEEVMAYDYTINKTKVPPKEAEHLNDYSNPRFWIFDLKPNHRHRHKKALQALTENYSDNLKQQVRELIQQEGKTKYKGEGDSCVISNRGGNDSRCVINNTSIIGLESDDALHNENYHPTGSRRYCLITGLDISMQKEGSSLLSYSGLRYYRDAKPALFDDIMRRYLTAHWANAGLETQIKEIAHNIRTIKKNQALKQKRIYTEGQIRLFDLTDCDTESQKF